MIGGNKCQILELGRFIAQGMVKVPKDKIPDDLYLGDPLAIMEWAREYFATLGREDLLKAVAYLDIEEDSQPGAVEVNGEDYEFIAQTREWIYFNEPAEKLQEVTGVNLP